MRRCQRDSAGCRRWLGRHRGNVHRAGDARDDARAGRAGYGTVGVPVEAIEVRNAFQSAIAARAPGARRSGRRTRRPGRTGTPRRTGSRRRRRAVGRDRSRVGAQADAADLRRRVEQAGGVGGRGERRLGEKLSPLAHDIHTCFDATPGGGRRIRAARSSPDRSGRRTAARSSSPGGRRRAARRSGTRGRRERRPARFLPRMPSTSTEPAPDSTTAWARWSPRPPGCRRWRPASDRSSRCASASKRRCRPSAR
jgi:hypothetical protein